MSQNDIPRPPARSFAAVAGLMLCAGAYLVGYAVRYRLVEPEAMGAACERGAPWWCGLRTGFIAFTQWNGFGWAALALAVLALAMAVAGRPASMRGLALAGLTIGGFGLILYNATMAAVAVVIALLCLARRHGAAKGTGKTGRLVPGIR